MSPKELRPYIIIGKKRENAIGRYVQLRSMHLQVAIRAKETVIHNGKNKYEQETKIYILLEYLKSKIKYSLWKASKI